MTPVDVTVLDWPNAHKVLEANGARPSDGETKDADGKVVDNGFNWSAADKLNDEIKVGSLKDMADKVLKLPADKCIKSFCIVGHGNRGLICVGSGQLPKSGKYLNGNQSEWEKQFARLCSRFCKDQEVIHIYLLGCNTGVCEKGARKLHDIAQSLKKSCAKGTNSPMFQVHGTKRAISADDVEDAQQKIAAGEVVDFMVSMRSNSEQAPPCLVPDHEMSDGVKKKIEKPTKDVPNSKKAVVAHPWPIPNLAIHKFMVFKNIEVPLDKYPAMSMTEALPAKEFLNLFNLAECYEPSGLATVTDGYAGFVRPNGLALYCEITLDHTALVVRYEKQGFMYFLKDPNNRKMLENLIVSGCDC